ncbi:MAG: endo-1,4-beta-xylanase [Micrococcales bacterium]|nr:endo-1,4-beta-xylanase [Micrococcales bacterium]
MRSLAMAGAAVMLATGSAAAAPPELPKPGKVKGTSQKVPAALFGMHDHSLTTTPPTAEDRFGGIRIWDNNVRWDQVNTAEGVYDWTTLDQVVANARATGAQDVMYVLGYTPAWAASNLKPPCTPGNYTNCEYFPGGSSSAPKSIEYWKTWVREVATRYKGLITQYQMWNEANLTAMFSSASGDSAVEMAQLTVAAQQVIREVDPAAKVITASSTIVQTKGFVKNGWLKRYLKALKARGGKPDGIAVHLYPWLKKGPGNGNLADRARGLDYAKQVISATGYKKLPILDTEMNYGNNRNNNWPKKKYSQNLGSAYLAQTYLESLHNGVVQVDWYGWDDFGLGIWPTSPAGTVLKPGLTYRTLLKNLPNTRNKGCTITKSVTVCLTQKGATRNYYVYRPTARKVTYKVPASFKVRQACDLLDKCSTIRKGRVRVGIEPVRLTTT